MLECCSIVTCCILSAIMLLIADLRHSCFACHLQTVHPFPVILISISTEIISSFQRHTWFAKFMPRSSFFLPEYPYALHIISCRSCHVLHHVVCALHRDWLLFLCSVIALGRAGRRVRERGSCRVCLWGASFRQPLELCRQDDHYPRYHFYLCLLVVRSIAMSRYLPLVYEASHIAMSSL